MFYRPIFILLEVPLPIDMHSFVFVNGFAFSIGMLAFLVYKNPEKNVNLLLIGFLAKFTYAFLVFYFYVFEGLSSFYTIFGIWDIIYSIIFLLFYIQLVSPDMTRFYEQDVFDGLKRKETKEALLIVFSLTGTGLTGMQHIQKGLERKNYKVDYKYVEPLEDIFRFPMSFVNFVKIVVRAIFRRPTHIKPLKIPIEHSYDLIVVESQTWLVGMSAPVEALFQSSDNRTLFEDRDVAVLIVSRGAWRRSQAMLIRRLQNWNANIVGTKAFTHIGWEPSRLFSLWFYLIYKRAGQPRWLNGFVQKRYGLSDEALMELETFGENLAERKRI